METVINLLFPVTFLGFMLFERLAPARAFPRVARWRARGVAFFVMASAISIALPMTYMGWVGEHRLLDLSGLGLLGIPIAIAGVELCAYGYHRACHRFDLLWRWSHQIHHSAERVDVGGAMLFHPFEVVVQTVIGSVVPFVVLGVAPEAALVAGFLNFFCAVFQHANIATPVWLGWIIQRPEAHALHHERDVHNFNFGNWSFSDALFGTYRNLATWSGEAGFFDGASKRLGAMLIGRDLSRPGHARGRVVGEPATAAEQRAAAARSLPT
jgi:sterol desaturase/sphingolipid hydroxylase (fatty acid hydroxylase superfamily)